MISDWSERSAVTKDQGYNYFMQMDPVTKRCGGMPFLNKRPPSMGHIKCHCFNEVA